MVQFHAARHALATLGVQERTSSRSLLFDEQHQLCGRRVEDKTELVGSPQQAQALAFCGIHVISPRVFEKMTEDGVFSIIHSYLGLAARGEKILAFRADPYYWRDLGRPENIMQAAHELQDKALL
jgi:NDP-sugar pyrophosphorylase family protein